MRPLADEWYIARQITLTISYTDQFEFPLTVDELWQRLIYASDIHISQESFKKALKNLLKSAVIAKEKEYLYLSGRKHIVELRKQKHRWSREKDSSVQQFLGFVRRIPWVKAVALTGSLAMNNARRENDIDFMIVTSQNRVWLTRLWVLVITTVLGKRRTTKGETPNAWCFNMWLSEIALSVPPVKRGIYTAYEVCQARWIYDVADVPLRFLEQNSWAAKYLPLFYAERQFVTAHNEYPLGEKKIKSALLGVVGSWLLDVCNIGAYVLQKLYMYPRLTREVVELERAYFHPRDTRRVVYTRWQHALRQSYQRH